MKIPPSTSPHPRMIGELRKLIMEARTAEIYEQREQITDKALRRLNGIEKILISAMQERGRRGGTKTAGPSDRSHAKDQGRRKPKKQAESDQM